MENIDLIGGVSLMPWDTNDYPESLKNLDTSVRKKAMKLLMQ